MRWKMSGVCKQIFFVFVISGVICLRVHVRVADDDNSNVEEYDQDYHLFNSLDPEDPPFQVPKDTTPVRKVTHHKFSVDEHLRKKRDNTADIGGFKRLPRTECGPWFKRLLSHTKGRPLHLSKVIAVNDSIEIPCYYCGDPASYRPPHRAKPYWMWRTLGRNTTEDGLWTYSSVLRGFRRHDKEFESRVNITSNDSLIIRNIQEKDSGMYFCARQVGTLTMWTFTEDVVNWFLRQSDQKYLRLFFHIDVLRPRDIPIRQVSTTDKAFPTPAPTIKDYRANLALFTYWGEWSTCSVCGEEGERWRTGICWARMIKDKYMEPAVFYHALLSSRRGVPCRSTLFKYFRGWRLPDRPDEKMVQACTIPCVNNTLTQRMTINLDKARYKDLAKAKYKNVTINEGEGVSLKCPRASLDTIVYWVKGSNYLTSLRLRNITNRRAEIDVYGVLRFHNTIVADTGFYSCWHTKKRQIVYALTVIPVDNSGDWFYHLRFVCLSFVFDTFVFIALLAVKHKHRHVQHPGQPKTADRLNNELYNEDGENYQDDAEDEWDDYKESHVTQRK